MNRFNITLDRPSGVYYAGEVITGSVTIDGRGEKCRSVLLECAGKARVHWHVGSGDNRTDYDGKKYYMESKRTLYGNFYKTTVLDNAGEDAFFGGAHGEGDMYIPCLPEEGTNGKEMKLIVRVCDYDWGKRDDNIGEVVIDARKLALSNEPITYDLTRNGKPEKGNVTLVANFIPTSALTPNPNEKKTSVTSEETLVLKVLRANGLRKADWIGKNDVYVQAWRAPGDLTMPPPVGKKLPEPDKKITLPNESMKWSFAFPTRADSPGSAVLRAGDSAYVAYYIKAEIDKKGWKNPSLKFPVTIIPTRPAPSPVLLAPASLQYEDQIKKMKMCCFACGEAGSVMLKFKVGRRAFAPGENVDLSGSAVLNNSTIPVTARIVLRQHIILSTTDKYERDTRVDHRIELGAKLVDPGVDAALDDLALTIPAVPPSFFGAKGSVAARREPLVYTYELSLQAKASSGHKVKIDIPILISALPPKAEAIEEASTSPSSVSLHEDAFGIQDNAILDDRPCTTVDPVTGLEDGTGQVVPASTGGGNIFEPDDLGSGQGVYHYQPQVVVFSSNTAENTPSAPAMEDSSAVDHAAAYNKLLEDMKMEYDARLTVDKWIKQYPSVASSLTPGEFAGVLKQILFSLEQATIARELTSGFKNNGRLTTEHINAALEACPYSKMEIVRVMAPYVSDPENKATVLEQLYSFEKEEAAKFFP
jgi:hypothetical protein